MKFADRTWAALVVLGLATSLLSCSHTSETLPTAKKDGTPASLMKALDLYIEDGKELAKYEIFNSPTQHTSDAGPFLNEKFREQAKNKLHKSNFGLPEGLEQEHRTQDDWTIWKPDWKKWKLDFGWMQQLRNFDHWNFEKGNPGFPKGGPPTVTFAPFPLRQSDLMFWVKLRLLKGRDEGDIESALQEVRHLSRLMLTVEDMLTQLIAVSTLKFERKFAIAYKANWEPLPETVLQRAKRFIYCVDSLANPYLPREKWNEAMRLKVGLCDRVAEVTKRSFFIRAYIPESAKDYLSNLERIQAETESTCHTGWVRQRWKDPTYSYFEDEERVIMTGGIGVDSTRQHRSPQAQRRRKEMRSTRAARESYANAFLAVGAGFPCYVNEKRDH